MKLHLTAVFLFVAASLSGFAATNSLQVLGTVTFLSGNVPSGTVTVTNVTRSNQIGNPAAIGADGSYATAEFHPFATIAADGDLIRVGVAVNGYTVTAERNYNDLDENSIALDVQVDDVPPSIIGVTEGAVTRENVLLSFNEGTGVLNGSAFSSGGTVAFEGDHTLIVTDATGNTSSVSFTIDTTPPVVLGVVNNTIQNTSVSPTFTEGTATLNGSLFLSGATVGVEGSYVLVVTDDAGNTRQVTFTLDTTPPTVGGVTNGIVTNSYLTPTFSDGTATLNGQSFLSGTQVSAEGAYTLVATDAAQNSTLVAFTIDRTPPPVIGVANNAFYRFSVSPIFSEGVGTLNGQPFVSGTQVNAEGAYSLVVADGVGNATSITFTVDFPNPPRLFTLSLEVLDDSVILRWTADATFFQIERSENGGAFLLQSSTVFGSEYTDTALTRGVPYSYRVTAQRDGLSESKETSAFLPIPDTTPPEPPTVEAPEPVSHGAITLRAQAEPGSGVTADVSELAPEVGLVTLTEVSAGAFEASVPVEPTVSGERTVAITVTDRAGNVTTVLQSLVIQPEPITFQFTLSLHQGVNFIHVPVKESGLERLSDLYGRLGGSVDVGSLVAINSAGNRFVSFASSVSTGLLVDVPLGDSAVFAVMRRAKEVTFTGLALSAEVRLRQGLNLVGVPRRRDGFRMSNIAAMSAGISIIIREEGGRFRAYPPSDAEARGGQGLLVVATAPDTLVFEGELWQNTAAAAPSTSPLFYDGITESELWSLLHALESEAAPPEAPPAATTLLPNYPNPFNPETWIPFQLAEESSVRVTMYASDGTVVRVLDLGRLPAGLYTSRARAAYWDGRNEQGERASSGVYFYRLEAGRYTATGRMHLLK